MKYAVFCIGVIGALKKSQEINPDITLTIAQDFVQLDSED